MQAIGIILLLAAGVILLFGQDGSFVPRAHVANADVHVDDTAKTASHPGF